MRFFTFIVRFCIGVALLVLLPGFALAFWSGCEALVGVRSLWLPFAIGTGVGLVLDQVVLRRIPGFETFEHELTHAVAALLFLRPVTRFVVTRDRGGWVEYRGGFGGLVGSDFIGFAPYILPTFTVVSVLARPLVPGAWFPWFDGWIGLTFGFHTWSTLRETIVAWTSRTFTSAIGKEARSDLADRGLVFSSIYVVSATLAIHGVLLAILLHGFPGVPPWWAESWETTESVIARLEVLFEDGRVPVLRGG